jgi:hypothetical protein
VIDLCYPFPDFVVSGFPEFAKESLVHAFAVVEPLAPLVKLEFNLGTCLLFPEYVY